MTTNRTSQDVADVLSHYEEIKGDEVGDAYAKWAGYAADKFVPIALKYQKMEEALKAIGEGERKQGTDWQSACLTYETIAASALAFDPLSK